MTKISPTIRYKLSSATNAVEDKKTKICAGVKKLDRYYCPARVVGAAAEHIHTVDVVKSSCKSLATLVCAMLKKAEINAAKRLRGEEAEVIST